MVSPYLNFRGQAKAAIDFYGKVFGTQGTIQATFGQMKSEQFPVSKEQEDWIMHGELMIEGTKFMFSDVPDAMADKHVMGSNITLLIEISDVEKGRKQFEMMSQGGFVAVPFGPTFFADQYGYFIDKFGIHWQFSKTKPR